MREPDALDGARILAVALLLTAGLGLATGLGLPGGAVHGLLQLVFLAVPLGYARAVGLRPFPASGLGKIPWGALAWTALASAASLWLLKGLYDGQLWLFREIGLEEAARAEEEWTERRVEGVARRLGVWGLSLFVVFPPVCEEMLFRGIVLRGFGASFGAARAVAYTALLFAAMHGTMLQVLLMSFLGLYFGTLVRLTGSLWPAILAHALNNLAVLVVRERYGPSIASVPAPAGLLVLAALVFGGALACLAYARPASGGEAGAGGTGGADSR